MSSSTATGASPGPPGAKPSVSPLWFGAKSHGSSGATPRAISEATLGQRLKQCLRECLRSPSPTPTATSISEAKSEINLGQSLGHRFKQSLGRVGPSYGAKSRANRETSGETPGPTGTPHWAWYGALSRAIYEALSKVTLPGASSATSAALPGATRATSAPSSSTSSWAWYKTSPKTSGANSGTPTRGKSEDSPRAASERTSWSGLGQIMKWLTIILSGTVAATLLRFYKKLYKRKEPLEREESSISTSKITELITTETEISPKRV